MIELDKQGFTNSAKPYFIQAFRVHQKKYRPHPRHRPESDFQTRLPVDAIPSRILRDPALNLTDRFLGVRLIPGQKEGLRKPWQMLMPIQLVNDFRVGRRGIHGVVFSPISSWPLETSNRIPVP